MYNRYIPNGTNYTRIVEEDAPSPRENRGQSAPRQEQNRPYQSQPQPHQEQSHPHQSQQPPTGYQTPPPPPLGGALEGVSGFLSGLMKRFDLGGLDTGDILLLLIILFIFLEGDDIEVVIVMGLMLLFGLGDKAKKDHPTE